MIPEHDLDKLAQHIDAARREAAQHAAKGDLSWATLRTADANALERRLVYLAQRVPA